MRESTRSIMFDDCNPLGIIQNPVLIVGFHMFDVNIHIFDQQKRKNISHNRLFLA